MEINCQYCGKKVKKYGIHKHQKTAKCLKVQKAYTDQNTGENRLELQENTSKYNKYHKKSINCEYCGKNVLLKNLLRHQEETVQCQKARFEQMQVRMNILIAEREESMNKLREKQKQERELELELQKIKELQIQERKASEKEIAYLIVAKQEAEERAKNLNEKLVLIAAQPKNINYGIQNHTTNNIIQIGDYKNPHDIIENHLTYAQVQDGVDGIARCIADNNVDSNGNCCYIVADLSRKVVKYRDPLTNTIIRDPNCVKMIQIMHPAIKAKAILAKGKLLEIITDKEADETTILVYSRLL